MERLPTCLKTTGVDIEIGWGDHGALQHMSIYLCLPRCGGEVTASQCISVWKQKQQCKCMYNDTDSGPSVEDAYAHMFGCL